LVCFRFEIFFKIQ
jgi:hypothetical protein